MGLLKLLLSTSAEELGKEFENFVGVNFWTMIFAWGNLIILFLFLKKILFVPLKKIIDASVAGNRLSAKKMGSILGMKSSDVNKIYLLHQYQAGRTGSWKLTPQQFINFLVDKVLADKSMGSKIGGNADDLRFAKKLINSVVAGRAFTHEEMADFFDDYSGTDDISLLYTLILQGNWYCNVLS